MYYRSAYSKVKIYTSYFGNPRLGNLPKDVVPIAICGKSPDWYRGLQYRKLAPKYPMFRQWKQDNDNDAYVVNYKEQVLESLDVVDVLVELVDLAGPGCHTILLLCYEKPGEFCHRHLAAEWVNSFCEDKNCISEWDNKLV